MFPQVLLIFFLAQLIAGSVSASSKMVYMAEEGKEKQIVLSESDGSHPYALTSGELSWHVFPTITADGRYIGWMEGPAPGPGEYGMRELNLVTLDREKKRLEQWTAGTGMRLRPSFSADGRFLAYSGPYGEGGRQEVVVLDLEAERNHGPVAIDRGGAMPRLIYKTHPRLIDNPNGAGTSPALSADARFLVYQSTKDHGEQTIVLVDLKTNQRAVVESATSCEPAISPDGRLIAYSERLGQMTVNTDHGAGKAGIWNLFIKDRLTGIATRVTHREAMDLSPGFRPDGSLLFSTKNSDRGFQIYEIPASEMNKESFNPLPLVTGDGNYYSAGVSGDLDLVHHSGFDLPVARGGLAAAKLGNRVYVVGGQTGNDKSYPPEAFSSRVDYYDLKEKLWREASPRSEAALGAGLIAYETDDHKRYLYAFGGFAYAADKEPHWQSLDTIERFDEEANDWKIIGHLAHPRSAAAAVVVNHIVYVLGGWDVTPRFKGDHEERFSDQIETFDLTRETLGKLDVKFPAPLRRGLSAVAFGKQIVVAGGLGPNTANALDEAAALDTDTHTWRILPRLPMPTYLPALAVFGKRVLLLGGMTQENGAFHYSRKIFAWQPGSDSWVDTGRFLSQPKSSIQAVPLDEESFGVIGGATGSGPLTDFEIFSRR